VGSVTRLGAQFETADVLGSVHDPSSAAVRDAAVTLRNQDTGIESKTKTGDAGEFAFTNVKIGRYRQESFLVNLQFFSETASKCTYFRFITFPFPGVASGRVVRQDLQRVETFETGDSERALEYYAGYYSAKPQNINNLLGEPGPSSYDVKLDNITSQLVERMKLQFGSL
jgi:hypothetical protein